MRESFLILSVLALSACVTDGWDSLPRKYIETKFTTLEDCENGLKYMIENDSLRDEREPASPKCESMNEGQVKGRYKQRIEFRDDIVSSFFPRTNKEIVLKVEAPSPEKVKAYFAQKTEGLDASAQTERKIP